VWEEPGEFREDMGEALYKSVMSAHSSEYCDGMFDRLEKQGITALTRDGDGYREALQHIHDAPPTLYVKGSAELEKEKALAMVGTRNPSFDGVKGAGLFAGELAKCGVTIVSGLARGIDTVSHTACLAAGGHAIAVLGNGLSSVYPPENTGLAARILESGGSLVSEMRPDDSPTRWSFPRRNRIISGLSKATFVVEGSCKSGAMITAGYALDEGKDVFAMPGSPFMPGFEGTNALIKSGASPVTEHWDIIEAMRWGSRPAAGKTRQSRPPELEENEKKVYNALIKEPLSFDELTKVTLFSVSQLNSCLTMLILRGIVIKLPGNQYRLA